MEKATTGCEGREQCLYISSYTFFLHETNPTVFSNIIEKLIVQVTKFKNYIQELERSVVPDNTGVIQCIEHINAHIDNAVSACRAAKAQDEPLISIATAFVLKDKIHPGQKAEHQWRFKPTSSKPGRKKGLTFTLVHVTTKRISSLYVY